MRPAWSTSRRRRPWTVWGKVCGGSIGLPPYVHAHNRGFAVAIDTRKRFLTCPYLVIRQRLCAAMALEGYGRTPEQYTRAMAMRIRVSPTCLPHVRSGLLDRLCSTCQRQHKQKIRQGILVARQSTDGLLATQRRCRVLESGGTRNRCKPAIILALYQHSCHEVQSSCNALSVKELQQSSAIGLISQ